MGMGQEGAGAGAGQGRGEGGECRGSQGAQNGSTAFLRGQGEPTQACPGGNSSFRSRPGTKGKQSSVMYMYYRPELYLVIFMCNVSNIYVLPKGEKKTSV